MIYWIRSFLKLKNKYYLSTTNCLTYKKGSIFYIGICFLLFLCGCAADYQVTDQQETRVIVDSFVQANKLESLDVLVALDTSGSMSDNFEDVSSGMELLRVDIENLTIDYKFGYITMDSNNLGFVGPYDSSSSAIDMLMAPNLLPSAIYEEGFAATYTFLNSEEGIYFSRPEADFLLFLISDENEQSSITASIFKEWLHEKFSDVRHDVVVVTQQEGSECGYAYEIGYKYEELASLYGKDAIDICEEDWSSWLVDSSYIVSIKNFINLSEKDPIVDSIAVYVDNEPVAGWSYIEKSNRVKLGFTPDHGSLVEVGYKVYM